MISDITGKVTPSPEDSILARESSLSLTKFLSSNGAGTRIRLRAERGQEESVFVPKAAIRLLADILTEMAKGNAVTLIPIHVELTTQQAAELLNVSRPYLIDILENGSIPFRKVGKHRRVSFQDLMAYKQASEGSRLNSLAELSALDQELGLEYRQWPSSPLSMMRAFSTQRRCAAC